MPSLLQTLFPCFAGDGNEKHPSDEATKEAKPREFSSGAPITVSEVQNTSNYPSDNKSLPPKQHTHSRTFELPGSSPDFHHEMSATHLPDLHPLARPPHANSNNSPRQSQQSDRYPYSPYTAHSALSPASTTGSYYRPSGSICASSMADPDEITPVATNSTYGRGGVPNVHSSITDALADRKRMFERLRNTNGGSRAATPMAQQQYAQPFAVNFGAVSAVEMEAPVQQQRQEPSELATREHVRNASAPREME